MFFANVANSERCGEYLHGWNPCVTDWSTLYCQQSSTDVVWKHRHRLGNSLLPKKLLPETLAKEPCYCSHLISASSVLAFCAVLQPFLTNLSILSQPTVFFNIVTSVTMWGYKEVGSRLLVINQRRLELPRAMPHMSPCVTTCQHPKVVLCVDTHHQFH